MKSTMTPLKYFLFLCCFINSYFSFALDSMTIEEQANASIKELYHTLDTMPNTSMAERIDWISGRFKGTIYLLGALGEGPKAEYDQYPRYRMDGFDCDTFVNTVLSLALARSLDSFQHCLRYTRYKNGDISYLNRNHFTSIDWNINNQLRGVLKDITVTIKDNQNKSVALYSNTLINKPGWYASKTIETIRLQKADKSVQEQRLAELKNKASQLKPSLINLPYIPLTALFSEDNKANMYLFSQIPNGAIIEIVRPNWDLRKQIGTELDISHLGFAIWIKNQLYFREASSQFGKVVDVPLIDYLNDARNSPTIKGINIQIVTPTEPTTAECQVFEH